VAFKLFRKLLRPAVWVTAERGFAELFFLLLFAVQAPILGPAAFGLVAAVMVFVAFWEGVPGHAMTDALISVRDIDALHYSTVTTTSALLCLVFGGVIAAAAGPLAIAFGDPRFAPIMRVMALLPLIQAFTIAPTAAAQREMLFRSTALRTIASVVAGGAVGLTLALCGIGVWALVWQAIVQRIVAVVVLWLAVPLKLGFAVSPRHLREVAIFAWPVMIARVMGWVSSQAPRLILGLFLGPADLGLFSLATRLSYIVEQVAIGPKAVVARVDLRRFAVDRTGFAAAVRRVILQISVLTLPLCVGGAAIIPTLFHAWLDPRWYGAIIPSQMLLLSSIGSVTFYVGSSVLMALNHQRSEAGVASSQSAGMLAAVAASAHFGLVAVAAAMAAMAFAVVPLPILAMRRKCQLSLRDILLPQLPVGAAAGLMGLAVTLLRLQLQTRMTSVSLLPILIAAGAVTYVALLALMMPAHAAVGVKYLGVRLRAAMAKGT
jgi:O-antigen/teichoic acid export membrane protein